MHENIRVPSLEGGGIYILNIVHSGFVFNSHNLPLKIKSVHVFGSAFGFGSVSVSAYV